MLTMTLHEILSDLACLCREDPLFLSPYADSVDTGYYAPPVTEQLLRLLPMPVRMR